MQRTTRSTISRPVVTRTSLYFAYVPSGLDQYLVRKRATEGFYVRVKTTGEIWLNLVGATGDKLTQVGGAHNDGAWHIVVAGYHAGTNKTHAYTDLGSSSIDAGTLGSVSNTDSYTVADNRV